MLTPRENLLEVFHRGNPEWIPLVTHVDPYNQPNREGMDPELAEAMGTVHWQDENTVRLSRYLGIEILDYISGPVRIDRTNVEVETTQDGLDTAHVWHTPAGDLREVSRQCREDGTSYCVEHLVKSASDLPALAAVFADQVTRIEPQRLETIAQRQELIGDDGLLMCFMPGTPMGMMFRVYSGPETLAYLYADAPDALHDLFALMERTYQEGLRISLSSAADAYVGMDDTSTTVISPAMFEEFNLDLTDQRSDLCHQAGKLYFHHSCGLLHDLLPLYRRTRMDAVHAFTPPPIGDVTIKEGMKLLGPAIAICAGTSAMSAAGWDPEEIRTLIRCAFDGLGPGSPVCLSLAAYPHRTMAQTGMIVEECRKWQARCAGRSQ